MNRTSKEQFQTILEAADQENAERVEMGLEAMQVTTKDYEGSLIEYYFGGMLFGFIQDGNYYSNGV